MDDTVRKITAEDINPRYNWDRALPALGIMGVDFEERVDFRRLHRYRLVARAPGARELRPRRASPLRRQQHPLRHRDQDRRMGARQALPLRAAGPRRRADRLGLRLGRGPSPALLRLARCRRTARPACSACAARCPAVRADEAPRRGDHVAAQARPASPTCRSASISSSRRCSSSCSRPG